MHSISVLQQLHPAGLVADISNSFMTVNGESYCVPGQEWPAALRQSSTSILLAVSFFNALRFPVVPGMTNTCLAIPEHRESYYLIFSIFFVIIVPLEAVMPSWYTPSLNPVISMVAADPPAFISFSIFPAASYSLIISLP